MKVIEVLGPGCNNCMKLEANAREAVAQAGIEAEIRHVTDYAEIAQRGVMNTPRARDRRQGRVGRQGRCARDDCRLAPGGITQQRYPAVPGRSPWRRPGFRRRPPAECNAVLKGSCP